MTTPPPPLGHDLQPALQPDPSHGIWLRAAHSLGFRVQLSDQVFVAYDGQGILSIAQPQQLDPEDEFAQLIFHELCHGVVQGPAARYQVDWGLSNRGDHAELLAEHACQRLQAALATAYGLRDFLAVTSQHRGYWQQLPRDPLQAGTDPAIELAQAALHRLQTEMPAWLVVLSEALQATAGSVAAGAPQQRLLGSAQLTPSS